MIKITNFKSTRDFLIINLHKFYGESYNLIDWIILTGSAAEVVMGGGERSCAKPVWVIERGETKSFHLGWWGSHAEVFSGRNIENYRSLKVKALTGT